MPYVVAGGETKRYPDHTPDHTRTTPDHGVSGRFFNFMIVWNFWKKIIDFYKNISEKFDFEFLFFENKKCFQKKRIASRDI